MTRMFAGIAIVILFMTATEIEANNKK